jgi:hypothetical protein
MSHKFKVSQIVKLRRMGFSDGRTDSGSTYEVVRLMPSDEAGDPPTGSSRAPFNGWCAKVRLSSHNGSTRPLCRSEIEQGGLLRARMISENANEPNPPLHPRTLALD